jgi:hypothetical protein
VRKAQHAVVLLGYVAISFLYFGVRLLPHPGRALVGTGLDPQIFVWSFAWWPHALGAGENPLFSHAVYAPDGINLAWATTVPLLAVAFSPLTIAFGPSVAYNVASLLMPALAAWTAYLLCRHLTGSVWASLAGGYLFGFSSYILGQQLGHLHLTSVFLVPLVALVVVRFVQGELDGPALTWRLGVLLGLQLWIGTEVSLTLALALATAGVLAFWLVPGVRPRLRALLRPVAAAYGVACLLASPLLVYAFVDFYPDSINVPSRFNADLVNVVVPTQLIALGGSWLAGLSSRFPSSDIERGAYLGLPVLVIVAWFAIRGRRLPATRFLVASLVAPLLLSLGTALVVGGRRVTPLPWDLVARLPLLNNVLPVRFAVFTTLAAAVIVALWASSTRSAAAILLPALAILSLVPAVWRADYRLLPERWSFFSEGLYRLCIPKGETVAIFPFGFWGSSMLWQAESDFWFDQAGGYLRPEPPPANRTDPTVFKLTYTTESPTVEDAFGLAQRQGAGRILSVEVYAHPTGDELERVGPVQLLGGVLVSPGCGHSPIGPSSRLAD